MKRTLIVGAAIAAFVLSGTTLAFASDTGPGSKACADATEAVTRFNLAGKVEAANKDATRWDSRIAEQQAIADAADKAAAEAKVAADRADANGNIERRDAQRAIVTAKLAERDTARAEVTKALAERDKERALANGGLQHQLDGLFADRDKACKKPPANEGPSPSKAPPADDDDDTPAPVVPATPAPVVPAAQVPVIPSVAPETGGGPAA